MLETFISQNAYVIRAALVSGKQSFERILESSYDDGIMPFSPMYFLDKFYAELTEELNAFRDGGMAPVTIAYVLLSRLQIVYLLNENLAKEVSSRSVIGAQRWRASDASVAGVYLALQEFRADQRNAGQNPLENTFIDRFLRVSDGTPESV